MKSNHGIRPRAGQAWVCRDGRTLEPDFLAPTDLQGFTATQVAFGATDGSLTGSSNLTWNGTTFGITGAATISTTLGVTGVATFTNATDASDSAHAAVVVTGGVAMGSNLWVGANAAAGIATYLNCAAANGAFHKFMSASTLRWQMGRVGTTHDWRIEGYDSGGSLTDIPLTIANAAGGAFTIVRPVSVTSTTATTSTSTGALVVGSGTAGGLAVGGNITAGGSSGENLLTLGNGTSGFPTVNLRAGSTHFSWFFTAQNAISEAFEIGPSTASGGATYDKPYLIVYQNGSVVIGPRVAVATNATDGFLYMPTCAGTPTGVPTSVTGKVAHIYDTTNNKLYVYNGAWKATAALT